MTVEVRAEVKEREVEVDQKIKVIVMKEEAAEIADIVQDIVEIAVEIEIVPEIKKEILKANTIHLLEALPEANLVVKAIIHIEHFNIHDFTIIFY
jgi:hypothetical protein